MLWDRATGEPVHRAIVWQDRRTKPMCDRLAAEGYGDVVREKTGLVLDPYFAGTKVAWLLENVEGLRARAERGELAFGTIDSWLLHKLTGGRLHATDVTNASRTLLLDIGKVAWDEELLGAMGIPAQVLPEVRPSSQVYAETEPSAFFGAAVPVAGAIGDQQAALFAQGCFEQGTAKNTYGTGSFVLMNTGRDQITDQQVLLRTIAYGLEGRPVEYALEGSILVTGSAVQWLRDELENHRQRSRNRGAGGESGVQRRRLVRAGAGRAGRPALGSGRARRPDRTDPGHHPRPHRPGGPGIHCVVDERRDRRDATRVGRAPGRAARRRRRDGEPLAHAVPVRRAQPSARCAREHGDDGPRLGLSRRPRHRCLRRSR